MHIIPGPIYLVCMPPHYVQFIAPKTGQMYAYGRGFIIYRRMLGLLCKTAPGLQPQPGTPRKLWHQSLHCPWSGKNISCQEKLLLLPTLKPM